MKKLILAATIGGATLFMSACGLNETVVSLDGEKVQKEEFYEELKTAYGKDVLSRIIENKVLDKEYEITDKEIQDEIKRAKSNFASEEEFKATIEQYGLKTDEQLNEYIKNTLLRFEAISDGVKVTDKQLKEFYQTNQSRYLTIEASHILVEKQEEAESILTKLKAGEDFAQLAQKFSKDSSAANGGSLGQFGKGQMVKEFEDVAFSLKAGELSGVVKTEFGFHIIRVDKVNELTLEKNKEDIKKDYFVENGKQFPEVMIELLQDKKVETKDEEFKTIIDDMIAQYQSTLQEQQQQQVEQQAVEQSQTSGQ